MNSPARLSPKGIPSKKERRAHSLVFFFFFFFFSRFIAQSCGGSVDAAPFDNKALGQQVLTLPGTGVPRAEPRLSFRIPSGSEPFLKTSGSPGENGSGLLERRMVEKKGWKQPIDQGSQKRSPKAPRSEHVEVQCEAKPLGSGFGKTATTCPRFSLTALDFAGVQRGQRDRLRGDGLLLPRPEMEIPGGTPPPMPISGYLLLTQTHFAFLRGWGY